MQRPGRLRHPHVPRRDGRPRAERAHRSRCRGSRGTHRRERTDRHERRGDGQRRRRVGLHRGRTVLRPVEDGDPAEEGRGRQPGKDREGRERRHAGVEDRGHGALSGAAEAPLRRAGACRAAARAAARAPHAAAGLPYLGRDEIVIRLQSYANGEWVTGAGSGSVLRNAVTGEEIGVASSEGLDFEAMLDYGRTVGGPTLRALTFHQRARILKALAQYLTARKDEFYRVSAWTGATKGDSWIDIDGGFGTLFAYASRGRREFPDETYYVDGGPEALSKGGTFIGRHICVPMEGVAG